MDGRLALWHNDGWCMTWTHRRTEGRLAKVFARLCFCHPEIEITLRELIIVQMKNNLDSALFVCAVLDREKGWDCQT